MLPDIDSLALFVQAAEMRNLTRAAEASHITVPAASRRLSLLEQAQSLHVVCSPLLLGLTPRHSRPPSIRPPAA